MIQSSKHPHLYKTEDGHIKIDTVLREETIWLTQTQMADLFYVKLGVITNAPEKHFLKAANWTKKW